MNGDDAAKCAEPVPADRLLAGGRYVLERRLTVGGMGEIWEGRDTLLERQVAVKLPRSDLAADPEFLAQFATEARHAAALQHPNVATVFDFGTGGERDVPYIVMELIDGQSLADRLHDRPQLDALSVRALVKQVASALTAAHQAGLCHRDVKPGNLLFRSNGTVAVTDFGIARAVGAASVTRAGELRGTVQYVAPEQVRGAPAGPASDMYALGVVAYECLIGNRPFEGLPMEVLAAKRDAPPPTLPASVPTDLADLVTRLLHPDPSVRPTAVQVVAAMSGAARPAAPHEPSMDPAEGHTRVLPLPPLACGAISPGSGVRHLSTHVPAATPGIPLRVGVKAGSSRRWQRQPVVLLAGGLALVLLLIAGVALSHRGGKGSGVATSDSSGRSARHVAPARPITIAAAELFHPGGSDSDHAGDVRLSFDGNAATAWQTQHYASATFGNLRPGVGILYDLGRPVRVGQIRLALAADGAGVQVHAGADPAVMLTSAVVASSTNAPTAFKVRLPRQLTARYWLIWFSRLPDGASHQAGIAEADFLS